MKDNPKELLKSLGIQRSVKNEKKTLLSFDNLNWKALGLFALSFLYIGLLFKSSTDSSHPLPYNSDYIAFWSAGKIADQDGFSMIYNLDKLKAIQSQIAGNLGIQSGGQFALITILPAPYLSFYMIPFKFISRIEIEPGYWIWVSLNLLTAAAYLAFFLKSLFPKKKLRENSLVFLLLLASFPVYINLVYGQLNIFLLVCVGEFVRNAVVKRPILSGIWLGGLLLKPQVLILLLPILFIWRYWRVIWGFTLLTIGIVGSSTLLSGVSGMVSYARLLTGWKENNAVTFPAKMINWRMIAVLVNSFLGPPFGWIIAGVGVTITLALVYLLVRRRVEIGTPEWAFTMLGVMAATLAVTWHAHAYMEVVIIPLILYSVNNEMLPERYAFIWVTLTPAVWIGFGLLGFFFQKMMHITILDYEQMVIALSGFTANLLILYAVVRRHHSRKVSTEESFIQ